MERLVAWPARNQERETNRQSGFMIAHPFAFGRSGTHVRTSTEQLIAIVAPDTESAEGPEQPMRLPL